MTSLSVPERNVTTLTVTVQFILTGNVSEAIKQEAVMSEAVKKEGAMPLFIMTAKTVDQSDYEEEEEKPVPPPKKTKKSKKVPAPALDALEPTYTQDQVEFMLNKMRREWDVANAHVKTEDDCCSVSSVKSTNSTKSTKSVKDSKGYMTKGQRMYILEAFTITQLRNMHTEKGRQANGSVKKELVYSAVNLVKTRDQLIDFILTSDPNFEDDSD